MPWQDQIENYPPYLPPPPKDMFPTGLITTYLKPERRLKSMDVNKKCAVGVVPESVILVLKLGTEIITLMTAGDHLLLCSTF